MALQTYIPSTVTVAHDELEGSPEEDYSPDGIFTATRVLKCAWDDREALVSQLLGGAVSFGGVGNDNQTIKTGALYPFRSQNDTQATGAKLKAFFPATIRPDGSTERAKYAEAQITVKYDNKRDTNATEGGGDGDENQESEHRVESFTEFLSGPPFQTCDKDEPGYSAGSPDTWAIVGDGAEMTKLVTGFDWVFTRRKQPQLSNAFFDLMGGVNAAAITIKKFGFTFNAETLLYRGASLTSGRTVGGLLQWDIEYRFGYRGGDIGKGNANWNKFWDFKKAEWIRMVRCDVDLPLDPYDKVNLQQLIIPNIPVVVGN